MMSNKVEYDMDYGFDTNDAVKIQVTCNKCDNKFVVYHLDWTHIVCNKNYCKNIIENNLYNNDDEPMIHQYVEE